MIDELDQNTARLGVRRQLMNIDLLGSGDPETGTAGCRIDRHIALEIVVQGLPQREAAIPQDPPGARDHPVIVALAQKMRGGALTDEGRLLDRQPAKSPGLADDSGVGHHEADPEHRRQHTRQRSDIDHPLSARHRPERRQRRLEIVDGPFEIVFDDHRILRSGQPQKRLPATLGQGDTRRVLVAGRDDDHVRAMQPVVDHKPACIHWLADQDCPRAGDHAAEVLVARLLHRDGAAPVDEHLDAERQGLLAADRDQDLVGSREDTAARQHLGPDLVDQRGVIRVTPARRPYAKVPTREGLHVGVPPLLQRKQCGIDQAVHEGIGIACPVRRRSPGIARLAPASESRTKGCLW